MVSVTPKSRAHSPAPPDAQLLGAEWSGEGRGSRCLNIVLFPMCLLPEVAFAQNKQAGASVGGSEILERERERKGG